MIKIKFCLLCGREIEKPYRNQKYCNEDCAIKAKRKRDRERYWKVVKPQKDKLELKPKICPVCGKEFIPEKSNRQIYCTTKGKGACYHKLVWKRKDKTKAYLEYKKYSEKNKQKLSKHKRQYFLDNKDKLNQLRRIRESRLRKEDVRFNLDKRIGAAMWNSLRKNKKGYEWEKLVNYNLDDLREHLESQFKEGMNWEEFLKGKIHIDHIIPKSWFEYNSPEDKEFQQCWALKNIQPLWSSDNLRKCNKWIG